MIKTRKVLRTGLSLVLQVALLGLIYKGLDSLQDLKYSNRGSYVISGISTKINDKWYDKKKSRNITTYTLHNSPYMNVALIDKGNDGTIDAERLTSGRIQSTIAPRENYQIQRD